MTAIFLVWNTAGAVIAADQSASVIGEDENGKKKVLFTENHKKLIKPKDHNFAIAHAGSSNVNSIPIGGIVSQWLKQVEKQDSLYGYVISFISWLVNDSNLDACINSTSVTTDRIAEILTKIRDDFHEKQIIVKQKDYIDSQFEIWRKKDLSNFFGNSPDRQTFNQNIDNLRDSHNDFRNQIDSLRLTTEASSASIDYVDELFPEVFDEVFGFEYDEKVDWHKHLRKSTTNYIIDYVDESWAYSHIMFVGYGTDDWIPSCVKIKLFNFDTQSPVIVVDEVSSPNEVWYEDLAQTDAVRKFFRPLDVNVRDEIEKRIEMNFSSEGIHSDISSVIDSVLDEFSTSSSDLIREKIDSLGVDKLQFIAEHMVAMESFRSYIEEYLPTVGGQIDCVKLTRIDGEFSE